MGGWLHLTSKERGGDSMIEISMTHFEFFMSIMTGALVYIAYRNLKQNKKK